MNERKFLIRNVKKARDLINGKLIIKPKDKSGDLVTNFDEIIEKFFIKKIKKAYPDFDIVSEEENSKQKVTKNCFIIDPIDGTNNFARKIPMWGIQVACIKNGETVASVIYLPVYDELYSADKSGAYLNDDKIHVNRQNEKIGVYTIGNTIPQSYEMQMKNPNYRHYGSAAFSLAMVACGKMSACFFKENIHPWDFIPGEYLIKMAGGFSYVNNHVKICANMQSWSNLLSTTESFVEAKTETKPAVRKPEPEKIQLPKPEQKAVSKQPPVLTKASEKPEQKPVAQSKMPMMKTAQKTEKKKVPILNLTGNPSGIPNPFPKEPGKSKIILKTEAKSVKAPEFFMEESEAIIETFKVEIPEPVKPRPLTVDEVLVDKKSEPEEKRTPVMRNEFKIINKPASMTVNQRTSLTEAKKRKIIM